MRYPSGWVVDAHDGTPDDFAKRAFRGGPGDYPQPSGRRPAFDFELWQPYAAVDLYAELAARVPSRGVFAHHEAHDQRNLRPRTRLIADTVTTVEQTRAQVYKVPLRASAAT